MKPNLSGIIKSVVGVLVVSLTSWAGTTLYENDTRISILEYKVEQLIEAKKEVQNQLYEPVREITGIERNMVTQMEHFDKIDYLNNEIQKQLKNGNIIKQKHNTGDGDSFGEEKPYNNTWG